MEIYLDIAKGVGEVCGSGADAQVIQEVFRLVLQVRVG